MKQGQPQPHIHSKAGVPNPQKWSIGYTSF